MRDRARIQQRDVVTALGQLERRCDSHDPRSNDDDAHPTSLVSVARTRRLDYDAVLVSLSGKQRRFLRSLGHHLEPVVQIGKQGITEAVIAAADDAITTHELVKIRRSGDCPATREEVAGKLGQALDAEIVQQLGHVVLLYRRHPEQPAIQLPRRG